MTTSAEIIIHRRVRLLDLAKELGNISAACRQVGVSRTRYCEWKNVAELYGLEVLGLTRSGAWILRDSQVDLEERFHDGPADESAELLGGPVSSADKEFEQSGERRPGDIALHDTF